jgi:tryptophan synthase alpha chain
VSAVEKALAAAKAEGRAALIGYLPAGFPTVAGGIAALQAMVEGGCDIVEIGFPYSDPLMDGPVIQRAAEMSLAGGTKAKDVLDTVAAVTATGAAAVLMLYWNTVEAYGVARFARDLKAAGGSGIITPDLVPDEAAEWIEASSAEGLDRIFLVAPSSTDARIAFTAKSSSGFIYAASTMGVTGTRDTVGTAASDLVARTKAATELPVCVGLGVSNGDQAAEIAAYADGVIVGSAFVRCLLEARDTASGVEAVRALAQELAAGCRRR